MRRGAAFVSALLGLVVSACASSGTSVPPSSAAVAPISDSTVVSTTELSTTTTVAVEDAVFGPSDLAEGWVFETVDFPVPTEVDPMVDLYDSVKRLVVGPKGMLAFGDFFVPDQPHSHLVVWHSEDGRRWQEVGSGEFSNAEIRDIAASDFGFVAVGNACSVDDPQSCMADPAVWTSLDGRAWNRVPHDPAVFPGCTGLGGHQVNEHLQGMLDDCPNGSRPSLEKVSATGQGFLATGMDPTWSMLWYSKDGLAWKRVDSSARPQSEKVGDTGWWVSTDHVGAWTEIGLLQQGQRCIDIVEGDEFRSECFGFIWSSDDGQNWSAIDVSDEVLAEWTPVSIIPAEHGAVVFGFRSLPCTWCPMDVDPELSAMALHTEDGERWSIADIPPADEGMPWEKSTAVTPFGFLAMAEAEDEPQLAAMWHSESGQAWTLVPEIGSQPEGLWINSVEWAEPELIMFGSALEDGKRKLILGRWAMP